MEHEWRVKGLVLPLFDQGKELEIRVKARFFEGVTPGDVVIFNNRVRRRIVGVRTYRSFELMLREEDPNRIFPGKSAEEMLKLLRSIYPQERELRGVYVFELSKVA